MLVEAGILKRELYDKTVYCPKCGSANVSVQYCCPFCLSFDIKRSSLIEHIKCGYMDIEEKFVSGEGLICPKCKRQLNVEDVDYRRAGLWCTCNKCGRSFDIPVPRHFCRNCQTNFTFENAKIREAYKYRLNEDIVKTAASEWAILAPIRKMLEDEGFKVETPSFMEGRSGVRHMFDIIAYNNGRKTEKLAINISTSPDGKPVPDHAIIDMFAKTYDSNIEKAILIAIPKISENGRKLANHYKISLIEAKTPEETIEKIKETLKQK
jgi:transcription elongation factor Elf1